MRLSQGPAPLPPVEVVDEAASTNGVMRERGLDGARAGAALLARRQTRGRGRRGHRWASGDGGLYLSVLLRPDVDFARLSGLSAACGLGVLEGLEEAGAGGRDEVLLKWPNDLVARGRKLGGILVEAWRADGTPFAVCGVGVNVAAPSAADLTPGADEPHALEPIGLAEIGSEPPALESLAKRVRDGIFWRVDAWACAARELTPDEGPLAPLLDDYHARLALLGGPVVALSPAGELLAQGVFSHVDAWGCAVVATPKGPRHLSAEEASLRPLAP